MKIADLCREEVLPWPRILFSWGEELCNTCSKPLQVYATRERSIISATYGTFVAVEREGYCPGHPQLPPVRSRELPRLVAPGANSAYDVLVRIGLARYRECRQSEEIRMLLSRECGIEVKGSTIRYLARKFAAYFQIVHEQSIGLLRAAMRDRGGYILHVDGTCDGGSEVLLLCVDSLSGQVLQSHRISSENHGEAKAVLQDLRRDWGIPLAIVHDLRRALITAVGEVFAGTPQLVCHYHLAADVGKDILSPHQDQLRRLFRRTKVRSNLRALTRSLKKYAISEDSGKHRVTSILELRSRKRLQEHGSPEAIQGAVHALASWILGYGRDGEGYGFPFDRPYLNLYHRILQTHGILCGTIKTWPKRKREPLGSLMRLKEILDTVVVEDHASEFHQIVAETKRDRRIFDRFRNALRICPKGGKNRRNDGGAPKMLSPKRPKALLRNLRVSLNRQACRGRPSQRACEIVVRHLDKYWKYLFGHVLRNGPRTLVVPRTNNIDEGLIGLVKRPCRRLHGRGHLGRDLETMPPAMPLIQNLDNTSYCETVYGGGEIEKIVERFSYVDPKLPTQWMTTWREDRISTRLPRKLERMNSLPSKVARFLSVAVRELDK